jgi:hypothetical protein
MAAKGLRFTTWSDVMLFFIVLLAMNTRLLFAYSSWFRNPPIEPAFVALILGSIVGMLSYLPIRYLMEGRFSQSDIISASVLLGLLVAHETIFSLDQYFHPVAGMAFFIFLFYFIFDEGTGNREDTYVT